MLFAAIPKKGGDFKGPAVMDKYIMRFGEYPEQIPKELYDKRSNIMQFLENNYLGMKQENSIVTLNSEFLAKIENEVKPE